MAVLHGCSQTRALGRVAAHPMHVVGSVSIEGSTAIMECPHSVQHVVPNVVLQSY